MDQTNTAKQILNYIKTHEVSLGVLLAAYGAFYIAAVVMSGWTWFDWGTDMTVLPKTAVTALLPRSFISPIFFVTGFPALLIGTVMLCAYSIRGIGSVSANDKEPVAVLLTAFGFAYMVIGAWPLGKAVDFPWEWQKQIISYGTVFAWVLYLLSFIVLSVGGISLYIHSRAYHRMHNEPSSINNSQN